MTNSCKPKLSLNEVSIFTHSLVGIILFGNLVALAVEAAVSLVGESERLAIFALGPPFAAGDEAFFFFRAFLTSSAAALF